MASAEVDSGEVMRKLMIAAARVRLLDFFQNFDKLRLKRVTPGQAVRALEMAGCDLSPAESTRVCEMYTDTHTTTFNYEALIADVNDSKPNGFFERNPDATSLVAATLASTAGINPVAGGSAGAFLPLGEEELEHTHTILAELRHEVAVRGILLKRIMRDFDDHGRGTVTRTRFLRAFSSTFPKFKPTDGELLARAYASADGLDVRYMVLHNDITPAEDDFNTGVRGVMGTSASLGSSAGGHSASLSASLSASGHPKIIPPSKVLEYKTIPADDLTAVEASLIRQVFERRIRVIDYFQDFDKLRRGHVTRSQFTRGVTSLGLLGISPSAIEALADKYAVSSDPTGQTVSYTAFSDEVEKAFTEKGLEKDPTKALDSFARTVVTAPHPRFVRPELSSEESAALSKALDDMTTAIRKWRRYNVKASLADYDKTSEGMVTETQFLRVLAMFDLVPQDSTERRVLLDYFRGRGVKSHMIDYRAFLGQVFEEGMA